MFGFVFYRVSPWIFAVPGFSLGGSCIVWLQQTADSFKVMVWIHPCLSGAISSVSWLQSLCAIRPKTSNFWQTFNFPFRRALKDNITSWGREQRVKKFSAVTACTDLSINTSSNHWIALPDIVQVEFCHYMVQCWNVLTSGSGKWWEAEGRNFAGHKASPLVGLRYSYQNRNPERGGELEPREDQFLWLPAPHCFYLEKKDIDSCKMWNESSQSLNEQQWVAEPAHGYRKLMYWYYALYNVLCNV